MESLVHYKQMLIRNYSLSLASEERQELIKSCLDLLRQLGTIDPLRKQRYDDLGEAICETLYDLQASYVRETCSFGRYKGPGFRCYMTQLCFTNRRARTYLALAFIGLTGTTMKR